MPIAIAIAAVGLLSLMDAIMKGASLAVGAYSASLLRSVLASLMIVPVWLLAKPRWPRAPVLRLHAERGVLLAVMALSFFFALTRLPLAEAIALAFVAPIIALYFAHLLLAEKIRKGAIWAAALGFLGTVVIVFGRLGESAFTPKLAWGLAALGFSALLYAYNLVITRKLAQMAGPLEIAAFQSAIGALVHLAPAPFLFVLPDGAVTGAVALAALLTIGGIMTMAWAYARAEAQVLVPLEYTGFLWAALLGWLMFDEPVRWPTMIGALLIVTGCWIAARGPRAKQAPTSSLVRKLRWLRL